jgi:hypothetical protein
MKLQMNETDWLDARRVSDLNLSSFHLFRKWRLFGSACTRRAVDRFLQGREWTQAIDAAENFADGVISWSELKAVRSTLEAECGRFNRLEYSDYRRQTFEAVLGVTHRAGNESLVAQRAAAFAYGYSRNLNWVELVETEEQEQLLLARDIFGNPFRPVAFDSAWRTSTVQALASQMYDSRDFIPMPILADALQDAGCENEDILAHCRGQGPHVRGCWVVDLVLGKS